MAEQVVMPKLGLTMEEGTLIRWRKKVGERVAKGEILLEVEGDKESSELECQFDGVLLAILVAEGATVPIKTPIALVGPAGEAVAEAPAPAPSPARSAASPARAAEASPHPADAGRPASAPAGRVLISPRARRLAEQEGLDWRSLRGSGPGSGRIQEKDIRAALAARNAGTTATHQTAGRRIAFSARRKVIARRLRESLSSAPHINLWAEIDCGDALAFKERWNRSHPQACLGLTDLIIKACGRALIEHERLNAQVDDDGLTLLPHADVGIAVGLDEGVLVPMLRRVETKSLAAVAAESRALVERARSGGLAASDMDGGGITVTNLGPFGVFRFTAIINPPQAAILAVGSVVERMVVVSGAPAVRPIMEVCLSADHRAVDGLHAAAFLKSLKTYLEDPPAALA